MKLLSINIDITLPESPQAEIIESWFDLISVSHVQPAVCHLKSSSKASTKPEWKSHSLVLKNTIFLGFCLLVKNHHCRKTSFFSVGFPIDSFTTFTKPRLLYWHMQPCSLSPPHWIFLVPIKRYDSHFWLAYDNQPQTTRLQHFHSSSAALQAWWEPINTSKVCLLIPLPAPH